MKTYLKKNAVRLMLLFIIAGTFVCQCNSQTVNIDSQDIYAGLGQPNDSIPFMQKVRRGTLPNGLKYYILKNNKPENRAFLALVVNAGSVLEKDDEQGFAHFVEHMAFKGTERFPQDELLSYLRSTGMRFGPDVNAYTVYDETVYHFEVPVETDENEVKRIPSKALDILDDWSYAVMFNQKDVDDERRIVLEEKRMVSADASTRLLLQKVFPALFKGSPYANRLPIGLEETIETAAAPRLKDFYSRWYRADNMALVIVGDFDDSVLEESLVSYFHVPAADTPLQRPVYDLPLPVEGHLDVEIFTDPEQSFIGTGLVYKRMPKPIVGDLVSLREYFMDRLISDMLNRRFDKESSKRSAPYVGAYAYNMDFAKSSRFYVLRAQAKAGRVEDAIRSVLQEKERILRYGWTDSEIELAKLSLMSSFEKDVAEKHHESSRYVSCFLEHFLGKRGAVVDYEWKLLAARKMFPLITAKDLANAAKDYFIEDDLTIFVLASEKDKLPSQAKICKIVEDVKKSKISRPVSETVDYKLLSKDPAPGSIVKETIDPETNAVILELSNGSKVILKQTANKDDEIVLYALAKGGRIAAASKDIVSARFASRMFSVSGIGAYSRQDILKKLSGKQASLFFGIDPFDRCFDGTSTVKDIKTLFELIYLDFTYQKFDSDEIKALIAQYKTFLTNQDIDPYFAFSKEITKTVYGNNPHFNFFEVSDLPKINQGTALKFIKGYLNPADYTFVFVGNIDVEAFKSYVEMYIASIAPLKTINNQKNDSVARPETAKKEIYIGKEDNSRVRMSWIANEKYSDEMYASVLVLSEYINNILTEHIRIKLGGAYAVNCTSGWNPSLNELSMDVDFSCDPKRVEELVSAALKDIENISEGDVNTDVLIKAKKAMQKTWENRLQDNDSLARSYARSVVWYNAPLSRIDKYSLLFKAVSEQNLKDIAAQLLKGKYFQVILYPEKYKVMQ